MLMISTSKEKKLRMSKEEVKKKREIKSIMEMRNSVNHTELNQKAENNTKHKTVISIVKEYERLIK